VLRAGNQRSDYGYREIGFQATDFKVFDIRSREMAAEAKRLSRWTHVNPLRVELLRCEGMPRVMRGVCCHASD
jgi:hypothetical protein